MGVVHAVLGRYERSCARAGVADLAGDSPVTVDARAMAAAASATRLTAASARRVALPANISASRLTASRSHAAFKHAVPFPRDPRGSRFDANCDFGVCRRWYTLGRRICEHDVGAGQAATRLQRIRGLRTVHNECMSKAAGATRLPARASAAAARLLVTRRPSFVAGDGMGIPPLVAVQ